MGNDSAVWQLTVKFAEALIDQLLKTATVLPADPSAVEEAGVAMSLRRQAAGRSEPAHEQLPRVVAPPK